MFITIAIRVTRSQRLRSEMPFASTRTKRRDNFGVCLRSIGAVKSLITGRDGYHRGAVVTVCSGDRVVEMTRLLNRLYPAEVESQVREERQNRNTNFPITLSLWEMPNRSMLVNIMINLKNSELFCFHLLFYSFRY